MKMNELPKTIVVYGKLMTQVGRGAYPYECRAKDEKPNAMIYETADGAWCSEYSICFQDAMKKLKKEAA